MSDSKLSSFIDDPHQKFYYTYNFERPFDFHVELVKIILDDEPGKTYPTVARSLGEAPKITETGVIPTAAVIEKAEEFDFLNELNFQPEDPEELEQMSEMGISTEDETVKEEEEEKDEFMDEFSDNEGYDEDDLQKDDY
jgi:hypothetical protein